MVSFSHELIQDVSSGVPFETAVVTTVTFEWFVFLMNQFNMFFQVTLFGTAIVTTFTYK